MNSDIEQQIKQIGDGWAKINNVPDDLTSWGFPGLTKTAISTAIGGMAEIASQLSAIKDYEPVITSKMALQQSLTNLGQYVSSHIPSNPQPHIPGLLTNLEQVRTTLRTWLEEAGRRGKHVAVGLSEKLAQSVSKMKDAELLYDKLKGVESELVELAKNAKSNSDIAVTSKGQIEQIIALLEPAQKSAAGIQQLVTELGDLKSTFVDNQAHQKQLFEQFESQRDQVRDLLGDANRASMAGSFMKRKKELGWPMYIWGGVFIGAVGALVAGAWTFIVPELQNKNWEALLIDLSLSAPLVWLGWVAAMQYGFTSRLQEDYSYKAASAMAYEGYKREAAEVDPELRKKLMETAIENFGENPLRVYKGHDNHVTPAHKFLDRLLKDEKLQELVKAVFTKIRG